MANYSKIYLIGIGGIGMSAIARYFNAKGYSVSGYDRTPSELTHELEAEGIEVHYEDNTAFVPKDPENTMVIYTPAIPHDMGELAYVNETGTRRSKGPGYSEKSRMERDVWPLQERTGKPPPVRCLPISSLQPEKDALPFWAAYRKITARTCL